MEIIVAVAKIGKYAVAESGDTLELIERPHGGISLVLADGQRSGKAAKLISNIVVRKAISLLADGVRDGAAARAAHDYLRTHRSGQVSATLNIVSVDLATRTLVISRNSHCPILLYNPSWQDEEGSSWQILDEFSEAIGVHARTKPVISELPLLINTTIIAFTDGVWTAGRRHGRQIDIRSMVEELMEQGQNDPRALADQILAEAIALDQDRPADDMSLLIVGIRPQRRDDDIRRMTISFPIR